MPRKKKRAYKKTVKEKPIVVNDNEEAFLNFVDKSARQGIDKANFVDQNTRQSSGINNPNFTEQNSRKSSGRSKVNLVDENAKQSPGFCDLGASGFQFDSGSDSSASSESSSSRSGGQFSVSNSSGESAYDKGGQKPARKCGRPAKTGKVSKHAGYMHDKSSNVVNASARKRKQREVLLQDPRYRKDLKACFAVVKKVMEMKESLSFNSPIDPVALGLPDYFDVIDTPMDFGTICNNLRSGLKYANAEDVYKDVHHIWDNCLMYNKKGDYIVYLMKRVKKKFMRYWTAAGLQNDFPGKDTGHSHFETFTDHPTRRSQHDAISMVNRVVRNVHQVQQNNPEPELGVLFPTYSNPYQLHDFHPQQSTIQQQRLSHLHANSNRQGHSHVVYPNEHSKKQKKHDSISTVNHMAGCQMQHGNFGTIQPQSQVPLTSYNQLYHSHLPQPSTTQPLEPTELRSGTDIEHNCLVPSSSHTMRRSKRNSISTLNLMVDTQARQDNCGTLQTQPQVPPSSYNQPYQLHQPHLNATQPPQVSQSQDDTYSDNADVEQAENELPPQHDTTFARVKRKRGRTRVDELWDMPSNEKIVVEVDKNGVPCGEEAADFGSFLGSIAVDGLFAPLSIPRWDSKDFVPFHIKMMKMIKSKFSFPPETMKWIRDSLNKKWRDYKYELKSKYYDPLKTRDEILRNIPENVYEDQWIVLVNSWFDKKHQEMSKKNTANAKKQRNAHTTGRKSYARLRKEMKIKNGKDPDTLEFFEVTHKRKDGSFVDEQSKNIVEKAVSLRVERSANLGSDASSKKISELNEEIFQELMGPKPGGRKRLEIEKLTSLESKFEKEMAILKSNQLEMATAIHSLTKVISSLEHVKEQPAGNDNCNPQVNESHSVAGT